MARHFRVLSLDIILPPQSRHPLSVFVPLRHEGSGRPARRQPHLPRAGQREYHHTTCYPHSYTTPYHPLPQPRRSVRHHSLALPHPLFAPVTRFHISHYLMLRATKQKRRAARCAEGRACTRHAHAALRCVLLLARAVLRKKGRTSLSRENELNTVTALRLTGDLCWARWDNGIMTWRPLRGRASSSASLLRVTASLYPRLRVPHLHRSMALALRAAGVAAARVV